MKKNIFLVLILCMLCTLFASGCGKHITIDQEIISYIEDNASSNVECFYATRRDTASQQDEIIIKFNKVDEISDVSEVVDLFNEFIENYPEYFDSDELFVHVFFYYHNSKTNHLIHLMSSDDSMQLDSLQIGNPSNYDYYFDLSDIARLFGNTRYLSIMLLPEISDEDIENLQYMKELKSIYIADISTGDEVVVARKIREKYPDIEVAT